MLEDELSLIVYIILYPITIIYNVFLTFINSLLGIFTSMMAGVCDIIVSFHTTIESIVMLVLPSELAVFVLLIVYILTAWFIIKLVKAFWDVLPIV
ncbi:hypothetical protein KAX97_09510 [candidate division WOR-3 bacterium]|nr:hypothetical protein [candidate division WOR-3 bacterium]